MTLFFGASPRRTHGKWIAVFAAVLAAATLPGCQHTGHVPHVRKAPDPARPLALRAGDLVQAWGKPRRLLVGLGGGTPQNTLDAQRITLDIQEHYLVGLGGYGHAWDKWSSPPGSFVQLFTARSDQASGIPMFTLYQMATWGDGNLYGLKDTAFMTQYWDNVRLMYQHINRFGKATLVNFEPDFWGYAQLDKAQQGTTDATRQFALVRSVNPDCANQPDTVAGMGRCLVQMARTLAPNAYVGFPPAMWGFDPAAEIAFLKAVGADKADFVVMQTLDRDAGCFEAGYTDEDALCTRPSKEAYWWDATNQTTPSFASHFALARRYHEGLELPLVWWQTPLGAPSAAPGGTKGTFRDNRVQYFLTKPHELAAAGAAAVVFGQGHTTQTGIDTDGGQFKRLSTRYFAAPAALP